MESQVVAAAAHAGSQQGNRKWKDKMQEEVAQYGRFS